MIALRDISLAGLATNMLPGAHAWATTVGAEIGATYEVGDAETEPTNKFVFKTGERDELRLQTFEESVGWNDGSHKDKFG